MNAKPGAWPRLAWLFVLLGAPWLSADDVDTLAGLWRTPADNIVALRRDSDGAMRGYVHSIPYGRERPDLKVGQMVIREVRYAPPDVTFESMVLSRTPYLSIGRPPTFVPFSGTLEDDGRILRGQRPEGHFRIITDANGVEVGLEHEILDGQEDQVYTRIATRLVLSDLKTGGWMLESRSKFKPPLLPCAAVTRDGTFRLYLPRAPLQGMNVALFLEDISGLTPESGRPVQHRLAIPLPPGNDPVMNIALEEHLPALYTLRGGPFIVRVIAGPPGSARVGWRFTTPAFTADSITAALLERLEDQCADLFGLSYSDWKTREDDDEDRARKEMWRTLYLRGRAVTASVEVANQSANEADFEPTLEFSGIFERAGAVVLGTRKLHCDDVAHDGPGRIAIRPGQQKRVDFGSMALSAQLRSLNTSDRWTRMRVRVLPAYGPPEDNEIVTELEPPPPGTDANRALIAKRGLATAMHAFGADRLGSLPPDPAPYLAVLHEIRYAPASELNYHLVYEDGAAALERDWEQFVRTRELLAPRLTNTGEPGLDRLDREVRKRVVRSIFWGLQPSSGVSIRGIGSTPAGWEPCCDPFVLPTPTALVRTAVLGAIANSEGPSFAFDPSLLVPGQEPPAAIGTRNVRLLPGITEWLWESTPNGLADDLRRNPKLAALYQSLLDPRTQRLSPNVSQKALKDRSVDSVRGALHEEVAVRHFLGSELERLRQAEPQGRFVLVSGDYVRGADLQGNAGKLMTDGVILEIRPDGTFRLRRIMEAKAGGPGASKVGMQFAKDAIRIRSGGIELRGLPPELRAELGVSTENVRIPYSPQLVDFSAPDLYMAVVPGDVRVEAEIGFDRERRRLEERRTTLIAERDAAPDGRARQRAQSSIDRIDRQIANAENLDRRFVELVGGAPGRERLRETVTQNSRQTGYSANSLTNAAENSYGAHATHDLRWNARELTFHQFKATTAANLPRDLPMSAFTEAELLHHWSNGNRFDPATGDWSFGELKPWERPVMTANQAYDLWRSSVKPATGNNAERQAAARERIAAGQRYHPERRKWISPDSPNSKSGVYAINPADPLLPDAEFVTWWQAVHGHDVPAEEIIRRRRGKLYDPATNAFRAPTDAPGLGRLSEKNVVRLRDEFGGRHVELLEDQYRRRAAAAEHKTDAAVEVIQRLTAALNEYGKLSNQELHVHLLCSGEITRIWVNIQTVRNGERVTVELPPDSQKQLLKQWYRSAYYLGSDRDLPDWLR